MWNWCGFHCPCSATIVPTQCRLIRTFIHTWRSLRQRSCWHACHKMKMVKRDSINIYNRVILLIPSFKTWLSTVSQRKLNKKDTRRVDFFRNKRKQHHCEQKRLTVFAVLLQPSACLQKHTMQMSRLSSICQACNHLIKILSWDHLLLMSSAYTLLPNHVRNNTRLVFIALLLWLRAMRKSHLKVSATFLLACLPPIGNSWENVCMSLCNICHLIHRTTESQKRN